MSQYFLMDTQGRVFQEIKYSKFRFGFKKLANNLYGRENEVEIMKDSWKKCQSKKTLKFVVITGLGGVGKSVLANNFAHQFGEEVEDSICIRISAATSDSILSSFQKLSSKMRIPVEENDKNNFSLLVENVYKKLSNKKCVLILDNLSSYDESVLTILVNISLKQHPKKLRPLIIITSRNGSVKEYFGNRAEQIQLGILSLEESIKLVINSLNISKEDAKQLPLKRFCKRLSCFPLALHQGVSYMDANYGGLKLETKFENMLSLMDGDIKKVLEFELPKKFISSGSTTYSAWITSLRKIEAVQKVGQIGMAILKTASFLHWENIPFSLVEDILKGLPECQSKKSGKWNKDAYHLLWDNCLCELNMEFQVLSINPLLQEVIRIYLAEENKFVDTLEAILLSLKNIMMTRNFESKNVIHLRTIFRHVAKHSNLMEKYAYFVKSYNLEIVVGEK